MGGTYLFEFVNNIAQLAAGKGSFLGQIVAAGGLAVMRERVGHHLQGLRIHVAAAGLVLLRVDVLRPIKQNRFRRLAVAARTADLLVIASERFAYVGVIDETNVWLVHAH